MPEPTIDAAVEQVVKNSSDQDALTAATRELAGLLGFDLVPKAPAQLNVGDRVRATSGKFTGAVGTIADIDPEYTAGPVLTHLDAGQCGRPYRVAHGFQLEELEHESHPADGHDAEIGGPA
jgi:hypothetical protein